MGYEFGAAPAEVIDEQIFDDAYFLDNTGLGPEETAAEVSYNGHVGTLAQALQDKKCPLRDMIAEGFQEEGLAGTQKKLDAFAVLSGSKIMVSDTTRAFHAGTISRDTILGKPEPAKQDEPPKPERAAFLARLNLSGR